MSCFTLFFGLCKADAGLLSFFPSSFFSFFSFAKLLGIAGGFLEPDLPLPLLPRPRPRPRPWPRPRPRPRPRTFLGGNSESDETSPFSSSLQPAACLNAFWACYLKPKKRNCWNRNPKKTSIDAFMIAAPSFTLWPNLFNSFSQLATACWTGRGKGSSGFNKGARSWQRKHRCKIKHDASI